MHMLCEFGYPPDSEVDFEVKVDIARLLIKSGANPLRMDSNALVWLREGQRWRGWCRG